MTLGEIATVIRSKNAGATKTTLDIFFPDKESYKAVKSANLINAETIARLYRLPERYVYNIVMYDLVRAIKVTIKRHAVCGSPGDPDVYACLQYLPLAGLQIPDEILARRSLGGGK